MKQNKIFIALAVASFFLASCQKASTIYEVIKGKGGGDQGYVLTLSNQTTGNKVLAYSRSASGKLAYLGSYATGGKGTGSGLGNQGAVILSEEENILLAVNPGSNSISSFTLSGKTPKLASTISSGGVMPVSITLHKGIVYVLNAGGSGNISGFHLYPDGSLHAISNSTRPLSNSTAGAAQISFVADGKAVAITEKANNKIITYTISMQGMPGAMHSISSANDTPFGYAVGSNGFIYVSEAAGGAPDASTVSSYHISANGMISLVDGPVSAGQTAACWVVLTKNEKYVYATNTQSNTVSSFSADYKGNLDVLSAASAMTGMGSTPIDAALSYHSKFLYVLNSGNESIGVFAVGNDGSLSHIENVTGLPNGATGLAAK